MPVDTRQLCCVQYAKLAREWAFHIIQWIVYSHFGSRNRHSMWFQNIRNSQRHWIHVDYLMHCCTHAHIDYSLALHLLPILIINTHNLYDTLCKFCSITCVELWLFQHTYERLLNTKAVQFQCFVSAYPSCHNWCCY